MNPYQAVRDFEAALCEYTGAPFAVTTSSCTMALLLAVKWHMELTTCPDYIADFGSCAGHPYVEIPARTYCSVPMSIWHAGGCPVFRDEEWLGMYQLRPLPVWDSARYFTKDLYKQHGGFCCVSFHASKTLGHTQGGAILHDNADADAWFRRMRFDGRTEGVAPKDDNFSEIGYHCYMSPDVAAALHLKLNSLPRHNVPLPNDPYPDLSKLEIFR